LTQGRTLKALGGNIGREAARANGDHGQTDSVDGDAVAQMEFRRRDGRPDSQANLAAFPAKLAHRSQILDQSGEHPHTSPSISVSSPNRRTRTPDNLRASASRSGP